MIGLWRHFVCKKYAQVYKVDHVSKGDKVNDLSFKWNAFLKVTLVDETMFIAFILLSWNVS